MARGYEIQVDANMQVECSVCGDTLEITDDDGGWRGVYSLTVKPCATCLENAAQAAREDAENESA